MYILKKNLGPAKRKRVMRLYDAQLGHRDYAGTLGKVITVQRYYVKYQYDFYVEYLDAEKKKRKIWYPHNFIKDKKVKSK